MFSIIGRIALLFWPFFVEVFLKNDDVKYVLRRHWVGLIMFGVLTVLTILFIYTTDLFHQTHSQYESVNEDYVSLELDHNELIMVRNALRRELNEVYAQFETFEQRIDTIVDENRRLTQRRDELINLVSELEQTCTVVRRSQINTRLRQLGDP